MQKVSSHGDVKIGKKISFGFDAEFKTGEKCAGTTAAVPDVVYAQENAQEELNYTLINSIVNPASATGISRTPTFSALLNYPDSEEFAIEEQQASGQLKVRTFRAVYTAKLVRDSVTNTVFTTNAALIQTGAAKNIIGNQSQVNQPNTAAPNTATSMQTIANNLTTAADPNVVALVSANYDAIGARQYKLAKTGMQVNPLRSNTSYKFTITGRLEEKINNSWLAVKNPINQQPIIRTKFIYFKTNSESVNNGSATINNNTLVKSVTP
jgi:hypothetical protein